MKTRKKITIGVIVAFLAVIMKMCVTGKKRGVKAGFMLQINAIYVNLPDYDVIAIGTLTWWYTMAPAVLHF
ncbi:MAG: hypothetical protein V8S08_10095 [Lachnoclostridium sp.]